MNYLADISLPILLNAFVRGAGGDQFFGIFA
jgi:hypothetical protein